MSKNNLNKQEKSLTAMVVSSIFCVFLIFWVFVNFTSAQFNPNPINGVCGSINGTIIDYYPHESTKAKAMCEQWEFDSRHRTNIDSTNPNQIQQFTWICKWINGGTTATCSAQGSTHYYDNMLATTCGSANGLSFMTTTSPIGISYTNYSNIFLGNLCSKGTINRVSTSPVYFNQTNNWRTRECPTVDGNLTCKADLYRHSSCGTASNTGWDYIPEDQLCVPWSVNGVITYDPSSLLRRWTCNGDGGANTSYCQAWQKTWSVDIEPSCNSTIIYPSDWFFGMNYITSFPWNNACSLGNMSYRTVENGGYLESAPSMSCVPFDSAGNPTMWCITTKTAKWTCTNWSKSTPYCGPVTFLNYQTNSGECNVKSMWASFKSSYDLLNMWLCEWWYSPTYYQEQSDKWTRSCGSTSCEAYKSPEDGCSRAQYVPTKNYPTQWLCKSGRVPMMIDTFNSQTNIWLSRIVWELTGAQVYIDWYRNTQYGYRRERACNPIYQIAPTSYCKAERTVDGVCKTTTITNTEWFSTPQEVLDAWLCEYWLAEPLVPVQNTAIGKRSWNCKSNNGQGQTSSLCVANVKLPKLSIVYSPNSPFEKVGQGDLYSGSLVQTPVLATVTGFNPIYLTFTNPVGQNFKLFTQNTGFWFEYKDRAGNTGKISAFVDRIDESVTTAFVQYSQISPTTWNVIVTLTWWTKDNISDINFAWPCITNNTCKLNKNPFKLKEINVEFSGNDEWYFTITNTLWETINLPVRVKNIDRVAPVGNLYYSNVYPTNQNVSVQVTGLSENVIFLDFYGTGRTGRNGLSGWMWNSGYRLFTGNGSYVFKFSDLAGNVSYLTASVDWIDKNAPSAIVEYSLTGFANSNIVAVLSGFNKTWIKIINNSWLNYYTFTYNHEFVFLLEDSLGNKWSAIAKVTNIQKPILSDLISLYESNICHKFKKRLPVDIQGNEYNMQIITSIRNCLMKWYDSPSTTNTYFYPRREITRGEFITILGRWMRLVGWYEGKTLTQLHEYYMWVDVTGQFGEEISEADAMWFMFYVPFIQSGTSKYINTNGPVPAKEAKNMIWHGLDLLGLDTKPLQYLIHESDNLTRWEVAYVFANLIQNYEWTVVWNNLEFLKALNTATAWRNQVQLSQFVIKIIAKIVKIPDQTFFRVWLEPVQLKSDLLSIAQSKLPVKKQKKFYNIKTLMDNYLRNFDDPFNNENRNYNYIYTNQMQNPDGNYESNELIFK